MIEQRLERRDHVRCIELVQLEVSGSSAPVAYYEHRNLLRVEAALASHAAPMAGSSRQTLLALEQFEEEGFVGLDDPALVFGAMPGRIAPKAMTPQERRILVRRNAGKPPLSVAEPENSVLKPSLAPSSAEPVASSAPASVV